MNELEHVATALQACNLLCLRFSAPLTRSTKAGLSMLLQLVLLQHVSATSDNLMVWAKSNVNMYKTIIKIDHIFKNHDKYIIKYI